MKKSTKAALISGLVFPGLGHVFLRRHVVGLLLLCGAGWAIYSIATTAIDTAFDVLNGIESGSMSIDTDSMTELVVQRLQQIERSTTAPGFVLLVSWIIGIADSYRVGRVEERLKDVHDKIET